VGDEGTVPSAQDVSTVGGGISCLIYAVRLNDPRSDQWNALQYPRMSSAKRKWFENGFPGKFRNSTIWAAFCRFGKIL
jgi:hypothetical protein